jgi:hypothetical protein
MDELNPKLDEILIMLDKLDRGMARLLGSKTEVILNNSDNTKLEQKILSEKFQHFADIIMNDRKFKSAPNAVENCVSLFGNVWLGIVNSELKNNFLDKRVSKLELEQGIKRVFSCFP